MSHSRTISAKSGGPLRFFVRGEFITATVQVGGVSRAEVVLSTADGKDSPAGRAIDRVAWSDRNGWEHLEVPEVPGMSGAGVTSTVYQSGGRMVVRQSASVVTGSTTGMVMTGGGDMIVNGVRITPEMFRQAAEEQGVQTSSGIELIVRLPEGSSLQGGTVSSSFYVRGSRLDEIIFKSISGDLVTGVDAERVQFKSQSGDLEATGKVKELAGKTMSGDLDVTRLYGDASLSSMSGDIEVRAFAPGSVDAKNMSGDVRVEDAANLGSQLQVRAKSMSGRVRTP